ncbi:MAG: HmuY family protein [Myxococcota bacterium]
MRALLLTACLALCACAPDLRVDHPFDGQTTDGPLVKAEDLGGGVTKLLIDATNKSSQVFVDLDEGRELKPDEAFETNAWELAFRRFDISANSGASSPTGSVEVAVLKDVDFDALAQAPAEGFSVDTPERIFNSTFEGWYFYDLGVHRLITREELTYVVKTSTGAYKKLKMLSYYDENGTPASISLKYAAVAAP